MKQKTMRMITAMLCAGILSTVAHANDASPVKWPEAYSVESETLTNGMTIKSKLFVDGKKMRTETEMMGNVSVSIIRPDKGMVYTLMPAQKMVMEAAIPETPATETAAVASGTAAGFEKVGTSTINGQECTEYQVKNGDMVTTFFVDAAGVPVRMVMGETSINYSNFKAGTPEAALFEVPAGYAKPGEAAAPAADAGCAEEAAEEKPAKKKGLGGLLGR